MRPWSRPLHGRIDELTIESAALVGNLPGDPTGRPIWIYLPPGYDAEQDRRYPTIYMIQGMTGQVDMWRNRSAFRPTTPENVDALFAGDGPGDGVPPPAIVVFVDCWTSYGGSQYLDSPATGRYHTYLCDEVVPFVDARYRTTAHRDHRGITGKSSGGYGAMITPMLRPDVFGGLATHAGDALFEACYGPMFAEAARALRDEYDGSIEGWLADFRSRTAFTRKSDATLLESYGYAACYSADPDGAVRLPFDPATGEVIPEVWARWLRCDPVRMARTPDGAAALRSMRAIYIDAGDRDEYFLDLGAEAFRRACAAVGTVEPFFELFPAKHGGIEYRYPIAIRFLAERLGQ
jgi:S-formylglutathione hydrolase FrmB